MITLESAILHAYVLISQGSFDEAEQILKNHPDVLKSPSGADLLARLKFESGNDQEAKEIWERIHNAFPDFEPAILALKEYNNDANQTFLSKAKYLILNNLSVCLGGLCVIFCICFIVFMSLFLSEANKTSKKQDGVTTSITLTNVVEQFVETPKYVAITNMVTKEHFTTNVVNVVCTNFVDVVNDTKALEEIITEENSNNELISVEGKKSAQYQNYIPYTAKKGDTIYSLSREYKFRIPDFCSLNSDVDINNIKYGQQYLLPKSIMEEE